MPVSSLFLSSGSMAKLAVLSLLSTASVVVAQGSYILDATYTGDTFFSQFDFYTGPDATNGFVNYVGYDQAFNDGVISTDENGVNYMGVDYTTVLDPAGVGREAVRLISQRSFTHGLIITDLSNMPGGVCGITAGHYTQGPPPTSGEINIISGYNDATFDVTELFTAGTCDIANAPQVNSDSTSYGNNFNVNSGGVFATQWTSESIQIWFFDYGMTPDDITAGTPDPTLWGPATSVFQGTCDIDSNFVNNQIVFDTNFCNDLINTVWASSDTCSLLAPTCQDYVANNPGDFAEMYWAINSLTVYEYQSDLGINAAPSSLAGASSTVAAASSTVAAASSTIAPGTTDAAQPTDAAQTTDAAATTELAAATTAAASSTAPPASASSTPALAAYAYIGCIDDIPGGILTDDNTTDPDMTPEFCASYCDGYTWFGIEAGDECFCGDSLNAQPVFEAGSLCAAPCAGDPTQICGGTTGINASRFRRQTSVGVISLYELAVDAAASSSTAAASSTTIAAASSTAPPASFTSGPVFSPLADYEYIGCIDDIVTRILDEYHTAYDGMTLGSCASDCEDYQYFGLEYGRECYCGNSFASTPVFETDSTCTFPCGGDASETCGGSMLLSLYELAADVSPSSSSAVSSSSIASASNGPSAFPSALPSAFTSAPASSSVSPAASVTPSVSPAIPSTPASLSSSSFASAIGPDAAPSSFNTFTSSSSVSTAVSSASVSASAIGPDGVSSSLNTLTSSNSVATAVSSASVSASAIGPDSVPSSLNTLTSSSSVSASTTLPVTSKGTNVSSSSSVAPKTTAAPTSVSASNPANITSTILETTIYTITSCAATVTDCPARIGQVTTEIISRYTTICPVTATATATPTLTAVGHTSAPVYTTVIVTSYTDWCPYGLTTVATTQTQTLLSLGPSPPSATIPMVVITTTVSLSGVTSTLLLTIPFLGTTQAVTAVATGAQKGNVGQFAASSTSTAVVTAITSTSIVTVYPFVTPFYSAGNVTIKAATATGATAKPTTFAGGANVVRERSVGAGLIAIVAAMLVL